MATVDKDFKVKNGLVVQGSTATVNGKNVITAGTVDAKGDLIVGSADDAVARLGVGSNGQVLTAASGATYGLEWAAPAAVGVFDTQITFEGATADDYETTLTVTDPTADRTITLPNATGTIVLKDSTDTLTNKSISLGSNTVTSTLAQLNTAVSDAYVASLAGSETLTNKTIALGSNTVSGTLAQFNTAVTDADFATLAGTETLTNKTLTSPKINEDVVLTPTATELNYVDGVTSAIQTQLNNKASSSDLTTHGNLTEAHGATGAVVGTTNTQTLTNKTLTSPVITGAVFNDGSIVFEGATADAHETTFAITDPTADRTITFPDATGTVALAANVAALSGATFTGAVSGTSLTLSGNLTVQGTTTTIDSTTIAVKTAFVFEGATADGFETTLTLVDPTADRTLTLPDATDTLVGRATTDTLTNKTLGSAVATTALTLNATAELRLADTDSSHYVGFKAPATVTTNRIWTLPSADGTAGQVLSTDGSGTFSFATAGGGGAAFNELMLIGA